MAELALPLLVEAAKPIVEVAVRRVVEEVDLIRGFKKELEKVKGKIESIGSIVLQMTGKSDGAVEPWLKNALRIIHDAEDMLGLLAYENHRNVVMKRRPNKTVVRRLVFSPLKRVFFRTKMASWIRRINSDMGEALTQAGQIAQLKALQVSCSVLPPPSTMVSDDLQQVRENVDMSRFVGRQSDVDSVMNMLLPNSSQNSTRLSFVAIVGIGGMGKTTLAKQVFENKLVASHFNERILISVLKDFNIQRMLNRMLAFIRKGNYEDCNREAAIRNLQTYLNGNRYLLVLDDVWNTNLHLWQSLRNALEEIGGSKDSMVLTTTRDDAVAKAMDASSVHQLPRLSEPSSWSLFKIIAFPEQLNGDASAFKAVGRKIMVKCKGVPLAIRTIAGVLYRKKDLDDWIEIEESELWGVQHYETENQTGILPSLKLSYDHLPSTLKKCFCLCALWPKGVRVEKKDIIGRWMALGCIEKSHDDERTTMEDVGEKYLSTLIGISFVIVNKRNEFGEEGQYSLHDLVYDLARSVSMHERLHLEVGKKVNKVPDVQHLTSVGYAEITSDFPDKLVLKKLRSLDMLNNLPKGLLVYTKYLRVLALENSSLEVVPESIAQLKCLKYLGLENNPIKELPECVMKLYNLQSLFLQRCKPLSRLPRGLNSLVNLRHLGLSFHLCPTRGTIEQLSQLQTLPPLQLSERGFQISELGCLHHVKGILDIKGLELVKSKLDAEKSKLSTKPRLEQLRLSWDNNDDESGNLEEVFGGLLEALRSISWDNDDNCRNHEEVLDGLCPHKNIKLLSVKGYKGDKFPSWLLRMNVSQELRNGYPGTLHKLIKIELINCKRCEQLPALGHLQSLKVIHISKMRHLERIGPEFYGEADMSLGKTHKASSSDSSPLVRPLEIFKSLKELHLSKLSLLREWCESSQEAWIGYPSLEVLVIDYCPSLEISPNKFPSLKELFITDFTSSQPLLNIMANKRSLTNLKKLHIQFVRGLEHIPLELGECTSLQSLIVKECEYITCLPDGLSKLLSLEVLKIEDCPDLVSLPNLSGLGSLRELQLSNLKGMMDAPEGLNSCKSLLKLGINCCPAIETLPELEGLSGLMGINVRGMSKMIIEPPEWLYNLPCLRSMQLGSYVELNEFPDISPLLKMNYLKDLYLFGWEELQSLPEQLQRFTALETLGIGRFDDLEYLPDWLGNLSSLKILSIVGWEKLKKLPSVDAMKRLTNLRDLRISSCPLLEDALKINGSEYHKIAKAHFEVKIG